MCVKSNELLNEWHTAYINEKLNYQYLIIILYKDWNSAGVWLFWEGWSVLRLKGHLTGLAYLLGVLWNLIEWNCRDRDALLLKSNQKNKASEKYLFEWLRRLPNAPDSKGIKEFLCAGRSLMWVRYTERASLPQAKPHWLMRQITIYLLHHNTNDNMLMNKH